MTPALLLATILTARFLPETAFGAWLNRAVMHPFADRVGKIERKHLIFAAAMILILLVFQEALVMAGPLDMGLVVVWDASVYIDIAVTVWTIAVATRGAGAWRVIKPILAARLRRKPVARARRSRRAAAVRPANDDEGRGTERHAA